MKDKLTELIDIISIEIGRGVHYGAEAEYLNGLLFAKQQAESILQSEQEDRVYKKVPEQVIIDAVAYGFRYALESMNDGFKVPNGNVLQWWYYYSGKQADEIEAALSQQPKEEQTYGEWMISNPPIEQPEMVSKEEMFEFINWVTEKCT